jgi:beta-lactamase superfamily II metal-dependent hydrolase
LLEEVKSDLAEEVKDDLIESRPLVVEEVKIDNEELKTRFKNALKEKEKRKEIIDYLNGQGIKIDKRVSSAFDEKFGDALNKLTEDQKKWILGKLRGGADVIVKITRNEDEDDEDFG